MGINKKTSVRDLLIVGGSIFIAAAVVGSGMAWLFLTVAQ